MEQRPVTVRPVVEADLDSLVTQTLRTFGDRTRRAGIDDRVRERFELDRFVVAEDDGRIVGGSGAYSFRLTMPGGAIVPVCAVTWVTVATTHRRRGVMRSMLDSLHRQAVERGEVASVLIAAEASIYGNLGYGPANQRHRTSIKRADVRWRPDAPSGGTLRYAEPGEATALLPGIWSRAQAQRAGGLQCSDSWWREVLVRIEHPELGEAMSHVVLHLDDDGRADGFAMYAWGEADGVVELELFAAATPVAHAELWRLLTSLDLMDAIVSESVAVDDPLPWWLDDPRAVTTTALEDGTWVKVLDVAGFFGARGFATDDTVVVDAGDLGRWRIGATTERTDAPVDLSMTSVELGAISLGGVSASMLARAGRIREHRAGAARRLAAMLVADPLPDGAVHF